MAHDIMVSYSSKNAEAVFKIVEMLENNGYRCWYSSRDIKVSQSYSGEIIRAIKNARAMLLVLSTDFNDSPHTLNEVERAFGLRIPIIPLKMEPFDFNEDFEYFLTRVQSINGYPNREEALDNLVSQLKELLPEATRFDSDVSNIGNNEQKYLDALKRVYEDGVVVDEERSNLGFTANVLGITPERAKELEERLKQEMGLLQEVKAPLASEKSQSNLSPKEDNVRDDTVNGDLTWPNVGIKFLKSLRETLDPSRFPFTPIDIAQNDSIEENNCVWWSINKKYFILVALTKKRLDKINVVWGIFSESEKRDPIFRQACDEFNQIPEALDSEGDFHVNDLYYEFNSEEIQKLGFETIQRVSFAELNEPGYFRYVSEQLIAFINVIWGVASKNLIK